ncbi:helix-turn-helix domain-containing protein [Candidatus Curtissbacteria bacterium]|nr:helix-turn-helix domain-containing protein [Candidatus Curtissbacteria bacterium]
MDNVFTVKEIAEILKIHHLTVRRYIKKGKLKIIRFEGNVRITKPDLEEFLKKSAKGSKTSLFRKFF